MTIKFNSYRMILPDHCVHFNSSTGRKYFQNALDAGYMESYFTLGAQLMTQHDPTYCGLTSLVMVLNAFSIDPGVEWKGGWRWYHEEMLDRFISLDVIREKGLTLDELSNVAKCNQLETKTVHVNNERNIAEFRNDVKNCCKTNELAIIISTTRKALNQYGSGHFMPIGGYDPSKDVVLLLEPARFKYPLFWISLTLLWETMKTADDDTGKTRGYLVLKRSGNNSTALHTTTNTSEVCSSVYQDGKSLSTVILQYLNENPTIVQRKTSPEVLSTIRHLLLSRSEGEKLESISPEQQTAILAHVKENESPVLYSIFRKALSCQGFSKQFPYLPDGAIQNSSTKITSYRLSLPNSCVDFNSKTGRRHFQDALDAGYLESYFTLGAQLRTQDDPKRGGLSALVMVLNAFAIDPGVVWKDRWRWYFEDMLQCCKRFEEINETFPTLDQLSCIANFNKLESKIVHATSEADVDEFREHVKSSCKGNELSIVVSFERKVLTQIGSVNFIPIGGYNPTKDVVLMLDPARYKYSSFWVSLPLLWQAMNAVDKDSYRRGYLLIKKSNNHQTALLKLSQTFKVFHSVNHDTKTLFKSTLEFLNGTPDGTISATEIINIICKRLLQLSQQMQSTSDAPLFTRLSPEKLKTFSPENQVTFQALVKEIESLALYTTVRQTLSSDYRCNKVIFPSNEDLTMGPTGKTESYVLCHSHCVTVLLLALETFTEKFPEDGLSDSVSERYTVYEKDENSKATYCSIIRDLAHRKVHQVDDDDGNKVFHKAMSLLDNEVKLLQQRLHMFLYDRWDKTGIGCCCNVKRSS